MTVLRIHWRGVLAVLLTLALAACAPPQPLSPPAVPPAQAETQPLPPLSAEPQIWRPGHWDWDGRGYVWIPGEYQPLGPHRGIFQLGHWQPGPSGWVWQPARWM